MVACVGVGFCRHATCAACGEGVTYGPGGLILLSPGLQVLIVTFSCSIHLYVVIREGGDMGRHCAEHVVAHVCRAPHDGLRAQGVGADSFSPSCTTQTQGTHRVVFNVNKTGQVQGHMRGYPPEEPQALHCAGGPPCGRGSCMGGTGGCGIVSDHLRGRSQRWHKAAKQGPLLIWPLLSFICSCLSTHPQSPRIAHCRSYLTDQAQSLTLAACPGAVPSRPTGPAW